ncbi:MAG: lactonase family protein [Alphaproteobacteria bacterium]|nr:lactonase family protein [Alphaproteobacteria bacterium]
MKRLLPLVFLFAASAARADTFLYAGSYTAGTSKGIYAWRYDPATGKASPLGLVAPAPNPAHLWATADGRFLYAVNWRAQGNQEGDTVSAYAVNSRTGALTLLNKVASHGSQPNQVVLDHSGKVAVTVNYNDGTVAAFLREPDGKLGEAFYVDRHKGAPLSAAQPGPRAHGIVFSPDNRFMFVAELGLDRVYSYRFDARGPSLTPLDPPFVGTHAGAGPRRLQISPDGHFLYVNHETDSEVSVFSVNQGHLTEVQVIATVPPEGKARNSTAENLLDSSGRCLYVTNRGHDSLAIFTVNRADGRLARIANTPSGGRTPRNIRFDPAGKFLFAANENGGNIVEFAFDGKSCALKPTGVTLPIDTPGGLWFVQTRPRGRGH